LPYPEIIQPPAPLLRGFFRSHELDTKPAPPSIVQSALTIGALSGRYQIPSSSLPDICLSTSFSAACFLRLGQLS